MKYPILKRISKLLLLENYLKLINTFKIKKIPAKNVIYHIGTEFVRKGYFIIKGRVDCYNFKHKDLDLND